MASSPQSNLLTRPHARILVLWAAYSSHRSPISIRSLQLDSAVRLVGRAASELVVLAFEQNDEAITTILARACART
jgi:hypothetical protein